MKQSEVYKIAFAGGGTGGHLAPGIALAEELLYSVPCEVKFLIVGKEVEKNMLSEKNFENKISLASPVRKSVKGLLKFIVKIYLLSVKHR